MRSLWTVSLLLVLLAGAALVPAVAEDGEALAEKVAEAAEAQEYREEAPQPVESSIIKEAPPAILESGTGDISTTGPCSADIDTFCAEVTPGAGRIAECITGTVKNWRQNGMGTPKVSKECKSDLRRFKKERAENINKDLPLAAACKNDVDKFCKDDNLYPEAGAVLTCLREVKDELSSACKEEVFRTQVEAAEDFVADAMLHELCEPDAKAICADVKEGEGRIQECLREHRAQLSWDCQEELFRQEVENADDLRLSVKLFKTCLADKKKFCQDVRPGNNRAKDCLEDNMEKPGFSEECKTELEAAMERRASDFRLDAHLRELCAEDIDDICGYEKESLDSIAGFDGRVSNCLMDYRDEILKPECKSYVHKLIENASKNIRVNIPLADACFDDREQYCKDVAPGSANVLRCLQDQREQLSFECRATLFDMEVRMSESLDFQYPMKKACAKELAALCKDVPAVNAQAIKCLQVHVESPDMGAACKEEVQRQEQRENQDYRLNFRMNRACEVEVDELCGDVCSPFAGQACGGTVLRCLADQRSKLKDSACKDEVMYFLKMEVNDFRNDVILAEACRDDVTNFCADVEPGKGRVHECLRENRAQLSPGCKEEERKLNIIQSENINLRPRLKAMCKEERMVYCKKVEPGKGRVVRCLQENLDQSGFSQACRSELNRRQVQRMSDYRLDFGVAKYCKADINEGACKDAKAKADGDNAAVLTCLTHNYKDLAADCQSEVSRAVRMAIWSFQPGMKLTEACDATVAENCNSAGPRTWGKVGQCLKSNLEKIEASATKECKALLEIGLPRDVRQDFLSTFTMAGVHSHMRSAEAALGFKRGTLVTRQRGVRKITLTGWSALAGMASLIIVLLGGIYALYYQNRYGRLPDIDAPQGPMVVKGSRG